MATLRVLIGDITTVEVDAIVNAANSTLLGGGGVDGAIHRAAGPELLDECREVAARLGGCAPGDAVMTGAGRLPARAVIHTVGPVWDEGDGDRLDAVLASCYTTSLALAEEAEFRSIAFPNVSTGVFGYPKERAAGVVVAAVRGVLDSLRSVVDIRFVCFDDENAALYRSLLGAG